MADPRASAEVRAKVEAVRNERDPVRLLAEIRAAQQTMAATSEYRRHRHG
jgi:hypothetical protein